MRLGHFPVMTNADYHGGEGISKSHLDVIAEGGPMAYWYRYVNPAREPRVSTPALVLGSATHKAILEPQTFTEDFIVEPDDAPKRPTKTQLKAKKPSHDTLDAIAFWADFEAQVAGRQILTREQYATAWDMAAAVGAHPQAWPLLLGMRAGGGRAEQSYFAKDPGTGALVKSRFDFLDPGDALDLKTTADASEAAFIRSVFKYRYGVQEAWYRKVYRLVTGRDLGRWTFMAVQSTAPYQIGLYTLPRDYVDACSEQAEANLRAIVGAKQLDYWPDPGFQGVKELDVPNWIRRATGVVESAEEEFGELETA